MPQMNGKYLFDTIMECIDSNIGEGEITDSRKSAFRAITKATTYSIKDIKTFFSLTTGNSLEWYYRQRRLYHAFGHMIKHHQKDLGIIANTYGYADNASFNHAFKQAFSVSPTQARKNPELVKDNKLIYGDFQQAESTKLVPNGSNPKEELFMPEPYDFEEHGLEEYGFSPKISRKIADLADELEIPVYILMDRCFDVIADVQSNPNYLPPKIETAIDLGISSPSELEQICQYYDCKYFELNSFMVDYFHQNAGKLDDK